MGRKPKLLTKSPRISRSLSLIAILCGVVFCCDINNCYGQVVGVETTGVAAIGVEVTGVDTGSILSIASESQAAASEDATALRAQFIEFERQLNAILKTRRSEEREFVALVVNQIRLGLLPSKLVTTSFEWVRNKRPSTKYPFVYFERVLRLQAGRLGLADQVPPFDFSIYSEIPGTTPAAPAPTFDEPRTEDTSITDDRGSVFNLFNRIFTR